MFYFDKLSRSANSTSFRIVFWGFTWRKKYYKLTFSPSMYHFYHFIYEFGFAAQKCLSNKLTLHTHHIFFYCLAFFYSFIVSAAILPITSLFGLIFPLPSHSLRLSLFSLQLLWNFINSFQFLLKRGKFISWTSVCFTLVTGYIRSKEHGNGIVF